MHLYTQDPYIAREYVVHKSNVFHVEVIASGTSADHKVAPVRGFLSQYCVLSISLEAKIGETEFAEQLAGIQRDPVGVNLSL